MDTHGKSQDWGSGWTGAEATIAVSEVERILGSLESLYAEDAQSAAEAALERVGRILSTGSFAVDDVDVLTELEDVLDGVVDGLEAAREEIDELRARL